MEVNYMSKLRNRKSKNPGHFDLEGLCQPSPRLTNIFEVETSRVFTLPFAYFAHIIDFRSDIIYLMINSLVCSSQRFQ